MKTVSELVQFYPIIGSFWLKMEGKDRPKRYSFPASINSIKIKDKKGIKEFFINNITFDYNVARNCYIWDGILENNNSIL